ncbi:hypothetical protein RJ639_015094 [Escallonia herrerae]|uniref:Uncharacterized protein n=1 Tax=Escallonia herrerae TaxID=1293975 RepID=A0AA88VI68_9ASTE|nr:hypothetical protein RJ639_015094 [Escallonia herrerae]
MASLSTTSSPNCFQLRFAFNCRQKAPVLLLRMRVQKPDCRVRVSAIGGAGERIGNGAERRRNGNSWMSSSSSVDAFSGWSGSEQSSESGKLSGGSEPQRKLWPGGLRKQMEPLTTEQELSLGSAEQDDSLEEKGNEGNEGNDAMLHSNCLESKTGIDNDSSYAETNEATIENDTDVGHTLNDGDAINNVSIPEDLQNESAIDDIPVAPIGTPKLPESEFPSGSFVASVFEDSDGKLVDENVLRNENPIDVTTTTTSTNLNTDHQELVPGFSSTERSNFSFDSSSSSLENTPSEPIAYKISVSSQLDAVSEPQVAHKEEETVNSLLIKDDADISKIAEVSAEGDKLFLEMQNVNGVGSSESTLVSALAYQFSNDQNDNACSDINGSKSIFDSISPLKFSAGAGIPAPSVVCPALQALPGKVLVPAVVDQVQGQALAALQVLKVIEGDVRPGELCTRREYARWLVSASSALSRNTVSKVYPAMYIENVTELAYDDITPDDPDFPSIQGLAEAGLISSKLSRRDMSSSLDEDESSLCFYPESPLSRQDLVSWKMSLEKRELPVADRTVLQQLSGFIDVDKINPDACPALVADLSAGEQGITALAFGYTRLFQPDKPVTKAQAAIALATGEASDIVGEELARIEAESMAEKAVAAHSALVDQVEKDVNASFEKELLLEREKIDAVEKLAEEARRELDRLRTEREKENISLMKERAAVDSEMEVLSRLRREVEEQLQSLMSNKVEISYEKERLSKLRNDAEFENQEISRLQHELEVERKALSMARAWAEDEAKRAREQAKILEEARDRWERHGIKVVVDDDLREEADVGVTWVTAGKQSLVEATISRAEDLVEKLKSMAVDVRGKSRNTINMVIEKILVLISKLKDSAFKLGRQADELKGGAMSKVGGSLEELQKSSAEFALAAKEGARRVAGDCREGVEKLSQRFKT